MLAIGSTAITKPKSAGNNVVAVGGSDEIQVSGQQQRPGRGR